MVTTISRKLGEVSPAKKVAVTLLINLTIAIIVPILLEYFQKNVFSLTNEIVIGFLIATTLALGEILYLTQHIYDTDIKQAELWGHKASIDSVISDIRAGMHNLIQEQQADGFYVEHYRNELLLIQNRLQATNARKEIILDRHHISATHALLSVFDDPKHKLFRATHLLWETGEEFDVTYQVYFNAWLEKLRDKKVGEIRRVFVYHDPSDFQIKNAKKLLAFHLGVRLPIRSKIVSRSDLTRFKADFNISDGVEDFGIFSDAYVYLGSTRTRDQISGIFSRDASRIASYISCFDSLWNSPAAQPLEKFVQQRISESELFDPSYTLIQTMKPSQLPKPSGGVPHAS